MIIFISGDLKVRHESNLIPFILLKSNKETSFLKNYSKPLNNNINS